MSSAPPPVQLIALTLAAGVVLFAAVAYGVGPVGDPAAVEPFALPVALLGLIVAPIGYRVFSRMRPRDPLRAVIVSLAMTEAAAMVGLVVYLLGGHPITLAGALMHLILTGATWGPAGGARA